MKHDYFWSTAVFHLIWKAKGFFFYYFFKNRADAAYTGAAYSPENMVYV